MASGFILLRSPLPFRISLLILILLTGIPLTAQQNPATQERPRRAMPAEDTPQDVIKVDTDLVPIDVTVTDAKGRLIRNLKKEDFRLFDYSPNEYFKFAQDNAKQEAAG